MKPSTRKRSGPLASPGASIKVLFLDIDGVLVSSKSMRARKERGAKRESVFDDLDLEAISNLNKIIAKTGCEVVLSSTWRVYEPIHEIARELQNRGLSELKAFYGATPVTRSRIRGEEIAKWLKIHPEVEAFVIVDDDSDMGDLLPHLVKTSNAVGLTRNDAIKAAVKLLWEKPEPVPGAPYTLFDLHASGQLVKKQLESGDAPFGLLSDWVIIGDLAFCIPKFPLTVTPLPQLADFKVVTENEQHSNSP